jgi:hypothetical protein
METSQFQEWLEAEWVRIDREAAARTCLHGALFALANLYRSIPSDHRRLADEVIIGWAVSDDLKKRFDGLMLIDQFAITAAIPRLEALAERLKDGAEPFAAHDRLKVIGTLRRLSRHQPSGGG